jgi:hypothetical protein
MSDCMLKTLDDELRRGLARRRSTATLCGIPGESEDERMALITDLAVDKFAPQVRKVAEDVVDTAARVEIVLPRHNHLVRIGGRVPVSPRTRAYAEALGEMLSSVKASGGYEAVGMNAALLAFRARLNGDFSVTNALKELGVKE